MPSDEPRRCASDIRQQFLDGLDGVEFTINGDPSHMQPHVVNLMFPGVDSEALMLSLREVVAISNGAACTSASYSPSHVLKAMGLSDDQTAWSVRISWGPGVERIPADQIAEVVQTLRAWRCSGPHPLLVNLELANRVEAERKPRWWQRFPGKNMHIIRLHLVVKRAKMNLVCGDSWPAQGVWEQVIADDFPDRRTCAGIAPEDLDRAAD